MNQRRAVIGSLISTSKSGVGEVSRGNRSELRDVETKDLTSRRPAIVINYALRVKKRACIPNSACTDPPDLLSPENPDNSCGIRNRS